MRLDEFEDRINKTDFTIWKILGWSVLMIGIFAILGIVGNYTGMFGSAVRLPARVVNKTLTADNVIHNYEWFYDTYAAYQAKLGQISQYKKILEQTTDSKEIFRLRIELSAMQQTCRELTTRYDANATKVNRAIFKGREAPSYLETSTCE